MIEKEIRMYKYKYVKLKHYEFDPGSEWTLVVCFTHASLTIVLL